ncbi:MAG: hypothetical protein LBE62_03485 [Azonexus sp.]|jgi:hypothetical protein|nr:hypothetical protein [Azonexus sp.]
MTIKEKAAGLRTVVASKNNYHAAHSTSIDKLLSRLDGVRRTGPDTWMTKCPAHEDRSASLSIRALDDGRTLVHCFAGCSVHEVVSAAGMTLSDLMPPRQPATGTPYRPERRPFPAADTLRAGAYEGLVIAAAGAAILDGKFTDDDRERLITAVERVQSAITAAGLHHG